MSMSPNPPPKTRSPTESLRSRLSRWWAIEGVSAAVVLTLVSVFATSLVFARAWLTGRTSYNFLLWNLFLAWVPLAFAAMTWVVRTRSRLLVALTGLCWLAFFPNAGYVVTDLIHLRTTRGGPLWLDTLMVFSVAWAALLAGIVSLAVMHRAVRDWLGPAAGWLFTIGVSLAAGFGVFLGRFQRWNSWDIVTRPDDLVADTLRNLTVPRAVVFSLIFGVLMWLLYLSYAVFSRRGAEPVGVHPNDTTAPRAATQGAGTGGSSEP